MEKNTARRRMAEFNLIYFGGKILPIHKNEPKEHLKAKSLKLIKNLKLLILKVLELCSDKDEKELLKGRLNNILSYEKMLEENENMTETIYSYLSYTNLAMEVYRTEFYLS